MKHLIGLACCVIVMPLRARGKVNRVNNVHRDFGADRFAAGRLLIVERPVSDAPVAAGSEIDVATTVAGDALLAGGSVCNGPNTAFSWTCLKNGSAGTYS